MSNESALRDGNGAPTLLYEQAGETRRVSDLNPLPVTAIGDVSGYTTASMEKQGNGTVALATPSAGKKISIKGLVIISESLSGFEADIRFATSGKVVHKIYRGDHSGNYIPVNIEGNINEVVNGVITNNGAGMRVFFILNYQER